MGRFVVQKLFEQIRQIKSQAQRKIGHRKFIFSKGKGIGGGDDDDHGHQHRDKREEENAGKCSDKMPLLPLWVAADGGKGKIEKKTVKPHKKTGHIPDVEVGEDGQCQRERV